MKFIDDKLQGISDVNGRVKVQMQTNDLDNATMEIVKDTESHYYSHSEENKIELFSVSRCIRSSRYRNLPLTFLTGPKKWAVFFSSMLNWKMVLIS